MAYTKDEVKEIFVSFFGGLLIAFIVLLAFILAPLWIPLLYLIRFFIYILDFIKKDNDDLFE